MSKQPKAEREGSSRFFAEAKKRVATSGPEVASGELLPEISDNLIFLLSSVGSSERLLTARSLVRVQQGEPQKKRGQAFSLFLWLSLLS